MMPVVIAIVSTLALAGAIWLNVRLNRLKGEIAEGGQRPVLPAQRDGRDVCPVCLTPVRWIAQLYLGEYRQQPLWWCDKCATEVPNGKIIPA